MRCILIGAGANVAGVEGAPKETLHRLPIRLAHCGVRVVKCASLYRSKPVGMVAQPEFLNTVLFVRTRLSPAALLGVCKRLERAAGRGRGPRNGPRALDLDVLSYGRLTVGWPVRRRSKGALILPHPELHRRHFVLLPLVEVAPHWRHPVLRVSARALVRRLPRTQEAAVRL